MAQGQRHNRFSLRPACQKDASFILRGFICLCCNLDDLVGLTTPCRWRLLPLPSLEVPAPIAGWLAQWQSAADGSVPTALTGNGTWGGRAAGHRSLPLSPPLLALPYKVPSRLSLRPSFGLSAGAYSSRLDRVCVGIWSDCTSAIDIATGRGGQHSDDALTINCRAATHILQAIGEPERICVRHTRSHVGDPGNEIADALAKRTCKGKGAIDCASISEVAAAARCQTLYPQDEARAEDAQAGAFVGRARFLREQLESQGMVVAALQETRARHSETYVSATHVRFTSAKFGDGTCGVELWFARECPFAWTAQGQPLYFHPSDFLVVHWSPRLLAVRFTRSTLRILFVCLHAPHSADAARDEWWSDLIVICSDASRNRLLLCFWAISIYTLMRRGVPPSENWFGPTRILRPLEPSLTFCTRAFCGFLARVSPATPGLVYHLATARWRRPCQNRLHCHTTGLAGATGR